MVISLGASRAREREKQTAGWGGGGESFETEKYTQERKQ